MSEKPALPEPWLRGTLTEVDAVPRAVLHALELALEDVHRWCGGLGDEEINARPFGLAPVAFHLRHITRTADRLLTYAEGHQLSIDQLHALKSELDGGATRAAVFEELEKGLAAAAERIRSIDPASLNVQRGVGRKALPTSVGGLLVHVADHTQRHTGQAVTTAKVLMAQREQQGDTKGLL